MATQILWNGVSWACPGCVWDCPGRVLASPGRVLGVSWARCGRAHGDVLGASWARPGRVLGMSGEEGLPSVLYFL